MKASPPAIPVAHMSRNRLNGERSRFGRSFPSLLAAFLLFAGLDLLGPPSLSAASAQITVTPSTLTLDVFDFLEVTLVVAQPDAANAFTNVSVTGEFAREGGATVKVDGFCDANDGSVFRIRFMPTAPGRHTYSVRYRQGGLERSHSGDFTARDANRRGQLRVDPQYREHFVWAGTGEHYFWNGATTYYLMGWKDDAVIRREIDRLAAHKVNRLRVLLYGRNEDRPWGQPVKSTADFKLYLNPWPAARPDDVKNPGFDLTRFNVAFWQKYERMLRHARERGVVVSVIFFIGGQVLPTPFAAYSEDEQRYYRYGVARLAAFANITWDLGNEHDFHREVPKWCDWLGPIVKAWDPYDHLLSAHNKIYRTPGQTWNDMQLIQSWDRGQNPVLLGERAKQAATGRVIPQINEEYGYEDLWEKAPGQRAADTRRRCAWEIAMAGCYQTTGETANRGGGFPPDTGGGWVSGRGDDTMTLLRGYGHLVDFFTSFDWWRAAPRNDLVRGGAFCLAETGKSYAVYLPRPASVTLTLEPGNYHARWFNPRSGQWSDALVAGSPRWTPPAPADDGDWALLLRHDPQLRDTAPPIPAIATASLSRKEVLVVFTKTLDPRSVVAGNFVLDPAVAVLTAQPGEEPDTVRLTTGALTDSTRYTLTVRDVQDQSPEPNRLATPARVTFEAQNAKRPIVELRFNEGRGQVTANTGSSARSHATAALIDRQLAWTTNTPPGGGSSALDFGVTPSASAVEFTGDAVPALKGLASFTVSGWVNCRSAQAGSGGNRIVTTINGGGDGLDLVWLGDGRLQLGVNEWPDASPAISSPGQVPPHANASAANWRFFAVTYDSTRASGEVNFYFGRADRGAALDTTVAYPRGPVGDDPGPLAAGHFNSRTRADNPDRMFRGLLDEIRVHGSRLDGTGALTREQIQAVQREGAPAAESTARWKPRTTNWIANPQPTLGDWGFDRPGFPAGLYLQGVTVPGGEKVTNPVIYDNDVFDDVFDDELAMVMASEGEMNLAGLIVTPVLTDGWGFSKPEWIKTAFDARRLAKQSNLRMDRIPPITVGTEAQSEKAGEGKDSAGARLYIRLIHEQFARDPQRPLLVNIGGQGATLASAYTLDPSIAEQCLVYYTDLRVYNGHYAWASQLIAQHFRVVSWGDDHWWITKPAQNEWRVLPRPDNAEGKDNDANSGEWRSLTQMRVPLLDTMVKQFQTRGEYCQGNRKGDGYLDGTFLQAWLPGVFDDAALQEIRGGQVLHVTRFTARNEDRVKTFANKRLLNPQAYLRGTATPATGSAADLPYLNAVPPERLHVSDNHRFLVAAGGKPFFWLGDTAWELLHRLSREEVSIYLRDRAAKGFNVIQAVALAELNGLTEPNRYGHLPLENQDPGRPAVKPGRDNDYWDFVDAILDEAAQHGLHVGLLPAWGSYVTSSAFDGKVNGIFNVTNALAYGQFLGTRYRDRANLIWILGGDKAPSTPEAVAVWRAMARGITLGVTGGEDYDAVLMTYHTSGPGHVSDYIHEEPWLDFSSAQSSHGDLVESWRFIERHWLRQPVKPVIDLESSYPDALIPAAWLPVHLRATHPSTKPATDDHARRAAYWAVFAGAFGHTYGHNSIWQMYAPPRKAILDARLTWREALDAPSARQMGHLRRLIESRPMLDRVPDQSMLVGGAGESAEHRRALRGRDYAMIYTPARRALEIQLGRISGVNVNASWFNPRTGEATRIGECANRERRAFEPPGDGDWVLLIDDAAKGFVLPGQKTGEVK